MEWIPTAPLLDRLTAPNRFKRDLIRTSLAGRSEVPAELPFNQALALAAASDAHSRGIRQPGRVFDLVCAAGTDVESLLVVMPRRGGPPRLVKATAENLGPVVVFDLAELARIVRNV